MIEKSFWTEKISIDQLKVSRLMAAPIDGVTDSPFRRLIREFSSSELLFTEMKHVACVANERSQQSIEYNPIEQPLGFQISVSKKDFVQKAVEKIIARGFNQINVNCGCPAKAVIKSGAGSALMADYEKLKDLLIFIKKIINGRVPMTIKMRSGFKEKNGLEIAKLAQDCGADCIIIHPRLQTEKFFGLLDYELVRKIKETVAVPVIFSGNITSFERVKKVYSLTGVDGFMIGRALMGAPWKIKEIVEESSGRLFCLDFKSRIKCALKHLDLNIEQYGEHGVHHFKSQAPLYIRDIKNAAECRNSLVRSKNENEMRDKFFHIFSYEGGC
jgi:tRNA-dihydrouridine synthase B